MLDEKNGKSAGVCGKYSFAYGLFDNFSKQVIGVEAKVSKIEISSLHSVLDE